MGRGALMVAGEAATPVSDELVGALNGDSVGGG